MKLLKLWLIMVVVILLCGVAFAGQTVDNVKAKGFVQVGVNESMTQGFLVYYQTFFRLHEELPH